MSRKNKKPKDTSIIVPQRDKLTDTLSVFERPDLTQRQKNFIDLVMDKNTKIVFVNGPAGTSKTYLSVYCALHLLSEKRVSDLLYFRTIIESASKGLGSLPGEMDDKFGPFMMPLEDKLEELIPKPQIQMLIKEDRVRALPINYLRGASFNAKFLLADEAQNFTYQELTTLVTRYGKFSKMIICGDVKQSDINGRSGFARFLEIFDTEKHKEAGIHTFEFTKDDIVRSELLKLICETVENGKPEVKH